VEQNAKVALDIATYGYVLENGRIVMDAKSDVLIEDRDVKEFYLGLTDDKKKRISPILNTINEGRDGFPDTGLFDKLSCLNLR